jgi:hypothetical protein
VVAIVVLIREEINFFEREMGMSSQSIQQSVLGKALCRVSQRMSEKRRGGSDKESRREEDRGRGRREGGGTWTPE